MTWQAHSPTTSLTSPSLAGLKEQMVCVPSDYTEISAMAAGKRMVMPVFALLEVLGEVRRRSKFIEGRE